MKKHFLFFVMILMFLGSLNLFGQSSLKSHVKFYGFIRTFAAINTRQSVAGTMDLYYLAPRDIQKGDNNVDLNKIPSFTFASITTRLGVNISGFEYDGMRINGKIEADFYNMNKSVAILRLRQAYINLDWIKLGYNHNVNFNINIGQKWHPMSSDFPYAINLESGTPFNPFNRSPQIMANLGIGGNFVLTGGLIYQMQYLSTGPKGKTTDYMKYSLLPEMFTQITFRNGGFSGKLGVDLLNIKPRYIADNHKVSDRIMTISPFAYFQYKKGNLSVNAKTVLAQAGEHLKLFSGYGVSKINKDGSFEYTPMRSSVSYLSFKYGKKFQVLGMIGYIKLLGTQEKLIDTGNGLTSDKMYYFGVSGFSNLNQMVRFTPSVTYNLGGLTLGFEYDITAAQFGTYDVNNSVRSSNGLVTSGLHWVANNRILGLIRFSF